jgi:hypothetical protein
MAYEINNSNAGKDIAALTELDSAAKITIFTMPKKFVSAGNSSHNAKGVGIFILFFGFLILAAAFVALYYFVLAPQINIESGEPQSQQLQQNEQAVETAPAKKPIADFADETKTKPIEQAVVDFSNVNVAATSLPVKEITQATATAENLAGEMTAGATTTIEADSSDIVYGSDQDHDGLSDLEEAILGTNFNASDSDGDNYSDMAELVNLYNPAGGGKLIVNPNIEKYTNLEHNYSIYYLKAWTINNAVGNDSIIFQIDNNQFIQIVYQANTEKLNIENWYKKQFNTDVITLEQKVYKKGWNGVKTIDGMTYYLLQPDSGSIYALNYSLGTSKAVNYKNIYEVMVNSFDIVR